jgi:hypothetical protein
VNLARPVTDRAKTYVVERIATDVYEVTTKDGEADALFEVTRPFFENTTTPVLNTTRYRVYEKSDD